MSIQLSDGLANQPLGLVLEDLIVRFLANVPDEDLSSIERVLFQVEEAQWFYTDFLRQKIPYLPSLKMKGFSAQFLEKCPLIWKWGDPSGALEKFGRYKRTIPVRGVALFNKDLTKVVLVKGTESNTWSFPRGKISKDESDIDCAARECFEETSYDPRHALSESSSIERTIQGKSYKIYMVTNVPDDFNFQPIVRGEIAKIEWHDIKAMGKKVKSNPNKFFIVSAIWKPLIRWANKMKGVSNEEELLVKAEFKLKEYLGILPQAQENVDAGRELLNILQGSSQQPARDLQAASHNQVSQYQQFIHSSLPQHLHNLLPFFPYAPPPPMPMYYPSFVPPQNLSQPTVQSMPSAAIQPKPESLQKPIMSVPNSKEFLSILSQPKKEASPAPTEVTRKPVQESNRSKAHELMSVFKREQKELPKSQNSDMNSPIIPGVLGPQPSNHIEESLRNTHSGNGTVSGSSTPGGKMKILKRPETALPNPSAELLSLLKPKAESAQASTPAPSKPNGYSSVASADLMSLLKKPAQKVPSASPEATHQGPAIPERDTAPREEFDDFEDFEDFDALDRSFAPSSSVPNQHFEIDSDEDYIDDETDEEEEKEGNEAPVVQQAYQQPQQTQQSSSPVAQKPKVQILKRGDDNPNQGTSLLHLLNGPRQKEEKPDFSSIYGPEVASEPRPILSPSSSLANSGSFLSMLTGQSEKQERPQALKSSSSKALLDMLHRK